MILIGSLPIAPEAKTREARKDESGISLDTGCNDAETYSVPSSRSAATEADPSVMTQNAMEIIDSVEPLKRGPYGGAVGYIDFTGNMDTCIALRTLVIKDGTIYIQAGAGIVADSVPEMEYRETLSKARAMLKAIHIAETQLLEIP